MARTFTRLGREITMAAKEGGIDAETNPRLRALIQNAKAENMPKENVERAIKRAVEKDAGDYKEIVYEGYGPHGVAILVETATDNNTRTVANIRSYFNYHGGSLGTSGCLSFLFDRKSVFRVAPKQGLDLENLELELMDFGVDEFAPDETEIILYGPFESFGSIQKYLEENGLEIISSGFERIPNDMKSLSPEDQADVEKLLEKIENDEDVQNVFHNMQEN